MNYDEHIISSRATVLEALGKLNALSGKAMTLFVSNEAGQIEGSLTDGDVRRWLVGGGTLQAAVKDVAHKSMVAFRGTEIQVSEVKRLRNRGITLIPQLDDDSHLLAIHDFSALRSLLPVDAVLMAGGKGERLRPLTNDTPKPLLRVGDKCIIDYNIEALARNGITNISVTTNYLAEQIDAHFAEPVAGVQVRTVKEPCRLGTMGSLKLIDNLEHEHVLVMNSDLLTTINYEDFYLAHIDAAADVTVASIPYMVSVPFGIFRGEGFKVEGLEEKPTYNFHANGGIYLIKRELISHIPAGQYYDATDFMLDVIARGGNVQHFPVQGMWMDIGSPADFKQAQDMMKRRNELSSL